MNVVGSGQHECAQVLNNYLTLDELLESSGGMAGQDKPHLPVSLATPLHSILTSINQHPVKLLLALDSQPSLLQSPTQICHALQTLSLQLINQQREGQALKAHYLSYLVDLAHKHSIAAVIRK